MTKTIGYVALLYGKSFLAASIRSIINDIDEYHVIYSPTGSHGSALETPCPETRDELFEIANREASWKLHWHDAGPFAHEGDQRDHIHVLVPDADIVVVADSDEVYADGLARDAIAFAQTAGVRQIRLPFVHLWRSFRRGFAHDPAYPIRVICPKIADGVETFQTDKRIWHFGYSQPSEIVGWKMSIHGHKGQFRPNWFNDIFMDTSRTTDLHPVGSDAWNLEDIDQSALPSVLRDHPLRDLDVIP